MCAAAQVDEACCGSSSSSGVSTNNTQPLQQTSVCTSPLPPIPQLRVPGDAGAVARDRPVLWPGVHQPARQPGVPGGRHSGGGPSGVRGAQQITGHAAAGRAAHTAAADALLPGAEAPRCRGTEATLDHTAGHGWVVIWEVGGEGVQRRCGGGCFACGSRGVALGSSAPGNPALHQQTHARTAPPPQLTLMCCTTAPPRACCAPPTPSCSTLRAAPSSCASEAPTRDRICSLPSSVRVGWWGSGNEGVWVGVMSSSTCIVPPPTALTLDQSTALATTTQAPSSRITWLPLRARWWAGPTWGCWLQRAGCCHRPSTASSAHSRSTLTTSC